MFSLVYTTVHLAALQFNGLPEPPYDVDDKAPPSSASDAAYTSRGALVVLVVSVVHALMWLAQSVLCTACELAPVLAGAEGRVPRWCPQSRFKDTGRPAVAHMLGTLAAVKDFTQWLVVLPLAAALVECARREYMRANRVRRDVLRRQGAGVDLGGWGETTSGGGGGGGGQGWIPSKAPEITTAELDPIGRPKPMFRSDGTRLTRLEEEQQQQQQQQHKTSGQPNNTYIGNNAGSTPKRSGTLNHMYESRI